MINISPDSQQNLQISTDENVNFSDVSWVFSRGAYGSSYNVFNSRTTPGGIEWPGKS